jgi:hypothetical protein
MTIDRQQLEALGNARTIPAGTGECLACDMGSFAAELASERNAALARVAELEAEVAKLREERGAWEGQCTAAMGDATRLAGRVAELEAELARRTRVLPIATPAEIDEFQRRLAGKEKGNG